MSGALKSNTTLMELDLRSEYKQTQMEYINNPLLSVDLMKIGNFIGDTGATSLSNALRSNTTLTELDLSCEHEINST